ncbi:MAG: hypothetical protein HW416_3065 [Chloroflexi bacterium]|nr:hypothetical protein [Chloroflexota bacterium]
MTATQERAATTDRAEITFQDCLKTGPDTIGGRYLRLFWQPVHLSADLPAGRAGPIRIMSEDFTLYRGESGDAHVVAFRCAHRGTQLSTGWVEGDALRCFYHGWKYDASGQCIEQPAEPEPFCNRIKIRAYPTTEYLGLIFAYFGEGDAPEFERTPEFEKPEYVTVKSCKIWPSNFYTNIDNGLDMTHVPRLHPQLGDTKFLHVLSARETEYGARVDGWTPPFHFCMPNIQEFGARPRSGGTSRWMYGRGWRVPIDDCSHLRFDLQIAPVTGEEAQRYRERMAAPPPEGAAHLLEAAERVLAGEMWAGDLDPKFYGDVVNAQDYIAMVGIGNIANNPFDEHLGRADVGVSLLRSIWMRELRALAEGRPLKEWHRRDDLWSGGPNSPA